MQSGTGHSDIDRKKGILGMQGQSSAGDKIKSRVNTRQEEPGRKEIAKLSPQSQPELLFIFAVSLQMLPMLCVTLAPLWPTFTMPVGGGLQGRASS